MDRRILIVIATFTIGSLTGSTQLQQIAVRLASSTLSSAQIDATVIKLMEAAHVTGVGIAMFHQGEISYLHAYGFWDTEKHLRLLQALS